MAQPIYTCPFCDSQPFRTRYVFWRHIHDCIRKAKPFNQAVSVNTEETAVVSIGK